jgi:hypothetical protein
LKCLARRPFFDRNLHSRMPLVPTPAPIEALACVWPMPFLSGVNYLLPLPP